MDEKVKVLNARDRYIFIILNYLSYLNLFLFIKLFIIKYL